jgi:Family of unknown function (DUF6455)
MTASSADRRNLTLLAEMMERLGIEPAGGVIPRWSLSYVTALHRCQGCPSKEACREWLDSMPMSVRFAPCFCPNADVLFELQVEQPPDAADTNR